MRIPPELTNIIIKYIPICEGCKKFKLPYMNLLLNADRLLERDNLTTICFFCISIKVRILQQTYDDPDLNHEYVEEIRLVFECNSNKYLVPVRPGDPLFNPLEKCYVEKSISPTMANLIMSLR